MEGAADLELRHERDALRETLGRIGVWSRAIGTLPADEERDVAAAIESLGFPAIWINEGADGREALSHATWLLSITDRSLVATGVASMLARDALATANA